MPSVQAPTAESLKEVVAGWQKARYADDPATRVAAVEAMLLQPDDIPVMFPELTKQERELATRLVMAMRLWASSFAWHHETDALRRFREEQGARGGLRDPVNLRELVDNENIKESLKRIPAEIPVYLLDVDHFRRASDWFFFVNKRWIWMDEFEEGIELSSEGRLTEEVVGKFERELQKQLEQYPLPGEQPVSSSGRIPKSTLPPVETLTAETAGGESAHQSLDEEAIEVAARSVVLAAVGTDRPTALFRAFVFRRKGDQAFVVVPMRDGNVFFRPRDDNKFWILWNGPEPRRVEAKRVAVYESPEFPASVTLLAAPADQLPAPLKLRPDAQTREGATVYLAGYYIDRTRPPNDSRPNTFARLFTTATVEEVIPSPERGFGQLHIRHDLETRTQAEPNELDQRSDRVSARASAVERLGIVAVFNEQGEYIGRLVTRNRETYKAATPGEAYVSPLFQYFQGLEKPVFKMLGLAARSGDDRKVQYQCVMQIMDPFDKVRSPRLRVRRGWPPGVEYDSTDDVPPPKLLDHEWEVELRPGSPDPVVRRQIWEIVDHEPEGLYFADLTMPNPGVVGKVRIEAQHVYEDESGNDVLPKGNWLVQYKIFDLFRSPPGGERVVPEIPRMIGEHWEGPR